MYNHTTIPLCKCTMAVANLVNPPVKQSRRKRFRFAPEISQVVDTVLSRDDFTEEETSNYWWSKEKSHTIRSDACLIIETARANKDDDMIYLVDDSYKFAKEIAGYLKEDAIDDILHDPSLHTRLLEVWYTKEWDACGLESMISQLQRMERRADFACLRRYVIQMSKTTTRTQEEMAEIAIRLSLTSRVYARMVGHAEANILYPSERKAVRCHTIVAPLESKTSRITITRTRKSLPLSPKRSTWRRLMGREKVVTADV
jgi:hypothetical protein